MNCRSSIQELPPLRLKGRSTDPSLTFAFKPDNAGNRRNLESRGNTGWPYQVFPVLHPAPPLPTIQAREREKGAAEFRSIREVIGAQAISIPSPLLPWWPSGWQWPSQRCPRPELLRFESSGCATKGWQIHANESSLDLFLDCRGHSPFVPPCVISSAGGKSGAAAGVGESRCDRGRKFGRESGPSAQLTLGQTLTGGGNRIWESRAPEGNRDIR